MKASEVLASMPRDEWTTGGYCRDGKYCAIGWLAHCLGGEPGYDDMDEFDFEKLAVTYGITRDIEFDITTVNDTEGLDNVIGYLKELGL